MTRVRPHRLGQVPQQGRTDAWALSVRRDFPVLSRRIAGRRIVYLDSAATSQKPQAVIDAISAYYRCHNANIHRSVYTLAKEATTFFEAARSRIACFAGGRPDTTIFTRNATEAINLVAYAWGRANVRQHDVVLVTKMEHHSNLVPWQLLCQQTGAELRYLDVSADGLLRLDDLDAHLSSGRVKLAAVAHVSNVLGTINPVAEIVRRLREAGAVVLIDGSQAMPHLPVDVQQIGADFYAWTGHKALGPTGIGVLHGRRELLEGMEPFLAGGDMISTVDWHTSTWNQLPWKYEAGTSMIDCALAISAASYASHRYVGLSITEISSLTADWALGLLPTHVPAIREPCAVLHLRAVLAALGTGQPSATQRNGTETHAGGARADAVPRMR